MKKNIVLGFMILSAPVFATSVTVQSGSSTTSNAGETVTVYCEGKSGGQHGGEHHNDSCSCQLRTSVCIGNSSGSNESYITMGDSELWREGYCREPVEALKLCRTKLAELKTNGVCP